MRITYKIILSTFVEDTLKDWLRDDTLKDWLRDTLKEFKTGISNEPNNDVPTLQS